LLLFKWLLLLFSFSGEGGGDEGEVNELPNPLDTDEVGDDLFWN
jgi:hypothetical protein